MPELPEVEVVRQDLARKFKDQPQILRFEFKRKDLRDPMPIAKLKKMEGAKILAVHRRAKYLLIETEAGGILSHLGMTGTWRLAAPGEERDHDHIYLHLSNGQRWAFRDPRRFGIFEVYDLKDPAKSPRLKSLGPEPLSADFTGDFLWRKLRGKSVNIKVAIMDPKIVVGVGNIYASEALFASRIRPQAKAGKVSKDLCERLVLEIKSILEKSIVVGGSSISDFYSSSGDAGGFQNRFQVYDRKGLECVVCSTRRSPVLIRSAVMGGRSTFWCPSCQK